MFYYVWAVLAMLMYRMHFDFFEFNPTFIYLAIYIPLVLLNTTNTIRWFILSFVGIIVSALAQRSEVSEITAMHAYYCLMIGLMLQVFQKKRHEKVT